MEGIGCVLSGIWGCACGLTSYSENIGIIGVTKVRVIRGVATGGGISGYIPPNQSTLNFFVVVLSP